jgi:DNA-binding MarR family transcriptional regulator
MGTRAVADKVDPEPDLSGGQLDAWRGFLRVHARLTRAMSGKLEEKYRITLSEYEVMLKVVGSETGSLRLNELAERALLTVSGLSRLVDRLERRGLVERCSSEHDGRGRVLSMTEEGKALFDEMHRVHLASVRDLFLSHLGTAEQKQLAATWRRILDATS